MSGNSGRRIEVIERADVHKSCHGLEELSDLLTNYAQAAANVVAIQKKLIDALKTSMKQKATGSLSRSTLHATITVLEGIGGADSKWSKALSKECQVVATELKRWLKALKREESRYQKDEQSAQDRHKEATLHFERKTKKKEWTYEDQHRYQTTLQTIAIEMGQRMTEHNKLVSENHAITLLTIVASLARVADAEWIRSLDSVRKSAAHIGRVGELSALCEGGWGGDVPGDTADRTQIELRENGYSLEKAAAALRMHEQAVFDASESPYRTARLELEPSLPLQGNRSYEQVPASAARGEIAPARSVPFPASVPVRTTTPPPTHANADATITTPIQGNNYVTTAPSPPTPSTKPSTTNVTPLKPIPRSVERPPSPVLTSSPVENRTADEVPPAKVVSPVKEERAPSPPPVPPSIPESPPKVPTPTLSPELARPSTNEDVHSPPTPVDELASQLPTVTEKKRGGFETATETRLTPPTSTMGSREVSSFASTERTLVSPGSTMRRGDYLEDRDVERERDRDREAGAYRKSGSSNRRFENVARSGSIDSITSNGSRVAAMRDKYGGRTATTSPSPQPREVPRVSSSHVSNLATRYAPVENNPQSQRAPPTAYPSSPARYNAPLSPTRERDRRTWKVEEEPAPEPSHHRRRRDEDRAYNWSKDSDIEREIARLTEERDRRRDERVRDREREKEREEGYGTDSSAARRLGARAYTTPQLQRPRDQDGYSSGDHRMSAAPHSSACGCENCLAKKYALPSPLAREVDLSQPITPLSLRPKEEKKNIISRNLRRLSMPIGAAFLSSKNSSISVPDPDPRIGRRSFERDSLTSSVGGSVGGRR